MRFERRRTSVKGGHAGHTYHPRTRPDDQICDDGREPLVTVLPGLQCLGRP